MQPTTHILVGITLVIAVVLLKERRLPTWQLVFVTMFASVLPDLVDKPLAWTFAVMPSGRAGLHSLPIALPLVALVVLVAYQRDRVGYGLAFAWGYLAHIAADFRSVLTAGADYYYYPNLFWPLMEANPDSDLSFAGRAPTIDAGLALELVAVALLVGYILFDFRRRYVLSQPP